MKRRRFLRVAAAAGGLSLAPAAWASAAQGAPGATLAPPAFRWRGVALGAEVSVTLLHHDRGEARRLVRSAVGEIRRLEKVFSLYRVDSALARLNEVGRLKAPPFELVRCLNTAASVSEASGGAFDPTVQPLWDLYAGHFARPGADPHGPTQQDIDAALSLVGWRSVEAEAAEVRLTRLGAKLTLNGIAQGFVTDAVADLLRAQGVGDVLVDLGEIRACGHGPGGDPWRVGLAGAEAGSVARALPLADAALATSSPRGTVLSGDGRFHHLLDPRTGRPSPHDRQISVVAPRAALADALSTALAVLPIERHADVLAVWPGVRAYTLALGEGGRVVLGARPSARRLGLAAQG